MDSVPTDRHAYNIDLYASRDQGVSWNFVSNIAKTNGRGDMYEPFLVAFQGQLICYFSDGRDSRYSQKLTHVTSSDLVNWGSNVDDVTGSAQSDRPGMPTVAALPNGKWIMTYENGKNVNGQLTFPVCRTDAANLPLLISVLVDLLQNCRLTIELLKCSGSSSGSNRWNGCILGITLRCMEFGRRRIGYSNCELRR